MNEKDFLEFKLARANKKAEEEIKAFKAAAIEFIGFDINEIRIALEGKEQDVIGGFILRKLARMEDFINKL